MSTGMKAATLLLLAMAASVSLGENSARDWRTPRTLDGHPDLQGIWTSATLTRLERADEHGDRRALTAEEARKIEGAEAEYVENAAKPSDLNKANPDCTNFQFGCGYNNFWIDRGSRVITVDGEKRSSILIEPANGKVPALKPERQKQLAAVRATRGASDGPETRTLSDRCLLAFGSSSGPPMLPVLYNNHYQIVQNKDTVVILVEMIHDARIIRLNGQHAPKSMRKWMGDSVGHWEGDTLVVETTHFHEQQSFRGSTPSMKVTERFTRTGANELLYRFTVEDPDAFTAPFTGELPFYSTDEAIYEYACHEGNYALPGILAGEREKEKAEGR